MHYNYRQQGTEGYFPAPGYPGGYPGGGANQRIDRLERQVDRLNRQVDRINRRLDRIERQLGYRDETDTFSY
ncbi:hypothetical protein EJA13_04450 [Bacillus canaveralius]|nr:hypothetical protein [Bacillus canaveralius]RSK55324.1 hypothetical protein EJA13_04450 [Bacillus canaveralius]